MTADEVAAEVPTEDLSFVIAGIMESVWGVLSAQDQRKLEVLIGKWAGRDPDAALAWVRNLRHPQQRELGLSSIAAALATTDPERAFEVYTEQERVTLWVGRERIEPLLSRLFQEKAAMGPHALLDMIRRLPENGTNGITGLAIQYPEGFDYAALLDGLAEAGIGTEGAKPYEPTSPLRQWAVEDPDAALDYLVSSVNTGTRFTLGDLTADMKVKWGREPTQAWLGGKVAAMDSAQRQAFFKGTMLLNHPTQLAEVIGGIADHAEAQEVRYEALQAGVDGAPLNFTLLADLPTEQKLEVLGRLRGMEDTALLEQMLSVWEIPAERIGPLLLQVKSRTED